MNRLDRDAIAAIAGKKAANAPDAISGSRGRSGQIQGPQAANLFPPALDEQCRNAEHQTAEPCEAVRAPQHAPAQIAELLGCIKNMPQLGANDARQQRNRHHAYSVGPLPIHTDARAAKAAIHDESGCNRGKPHHQPECWLIPLPEIQINVNERQHIFKYTGQTVATAAAMPVPERTGMDFHRCPCRAAPCLGDTVCMTALTYQGLEVLYTRQQIAERVAEMGAQITRDLNGEKLVMVGVLKGAAPFLADLARAVQVDATFDFVATSSYGLGARSSGAVKLIKDLDQPIEGKNVLVVEDILDTGITLAYLRKLFQQQRPKTLRIATLLDKPSRRIEEIKPDYVGFSIPNLFVIGYGMDYAERYRNLPDICLMTPDHPE